MDNKLNYEINILPKGFDQLNKLPDTVNHVSDSVSKVNSAVNPLSKIIQLLESTNKILMVIGKVGVESFNKLSTISDNTGNTIKHVATEAESAKEKIKQLDDVKPSGFNLSSFADKLLSIQSIAQSVGSLIGPAFEEGMARQTAATNFATLLRGADDTKEQAAAKGKEYADALRNSTAATLYGTNTVNDAAKSMLSFGINDKEILPILSQIGDIAAGDAQKFGSLSLAFAQISSAGKLGGQDLMQLINAGFNPLQEISKKTGKSIGELKDDVSKGLITADMVKEAFASATSEGGQFNGMLEDIKNNTLQGKLAVLQGGIDDLKAKFFELMLPIANKLIPIINDNLIPAITAVVDFLSPVFDLISENIDTIGVFVGVILSVVGAIKIWTGVQTVLNAVMTANPIGIVVVAIAALIAWIYKVVEAWDRWGAAMTLVMGPLGMIVNIIKTIYDHWTSIKKAFEEGGIISGLKRIGIVLLDTLLKPIQQLLEMIGRVANWDWVKAGAEKIKSIRASLDLITEGESKPVESASTSNDTNKELESLVNANTNTATLASSAAKGTEAVATGGTRNTQITITLGNLVGEIAFNGGFSDNREQVESNITDSLLRLLYSAAYAAE